jgi:hypothetical protein
MNELQAIWIRKDNIHLSKCIALHKQLVKPLVYNCGTWAMRKADAELLESFHRQQLWRVLGIRWPNHISNKKVYQANRRIPDIFVRTEAEVAAIRSHSLITPNVHRKSGDEVLF